MITVHHLGVSQSERVVWLCEELGIPYTLRRYERDPVTKLAPQAYRALHPMGIAPVITDGDVVLPESGAILEYLIAKYGQGRLAVTAAAPDFADYLFWFHFANGTLMPSEMSALLSAMPGVGGDNPILAIFRARAERAYALIEARLQAVPFFAGAEFTAADIMMFFPLTTMRAFSRRDLGSLPALRAYLARIGERPAYRRALAKADPGMAPLLS
jgi:glutathione S-transferase